MQIRSRSLTVIARFFAGAALAGASYALAGAVAPTADASANADYDEGVAVFTLAGKGLMYEASIGGPRFTFVAKE